MDSKGKDVSRISFREIMDKICKKTGLKIDSKLKKESKKILKKILKERNFDIQ